MNRLLWLGRTWVYRLFDAGGNLLYIGLTTNVRRRLYGHRSASPWFGQVASTTLTQYENQWSAFYAEKEAIEAERPRYNIAFNGAVNKWGTWSEVVGAP